MKKVILLIIALSIVFFEALSVANETGAFKVIVHASNPESELTKKDISKLFLKKVKKWENSKEAVLPVDLMSDSPVRETFSKAIHGRKVSSIKAYWQKQIFSGRGVPPEEKKSDEEVLKYVAKNAGAIGYILESAEINPYEVKVLKIAKE